MPRRKTPEGATLGGPDPFQGQIEETGSVGPRTASPMVIRDFLGPALSDIPIAQKAFGIEPDRKRSGKVTGGGR